MKMRISFAILLGLALCAGVYAQDQNPPPPAGQNGGGNYARSGRRGGGPMGMMGRGVAGKVTAVAADHFTVKSFEGDTYTVNFSDNTRFMRLANTRPMRGGGGMGMGRNMGGPPEQIKSSEIKAGDVIVARGEVNTSAETVGAVAIVQLPPEMAQRMEQMAADYGKTWLMGRVTAVEGTKITIMGARDNAPHTFAVDENTDFRERRNPVTLADVKPGDMVRVTGKVINGTFTAATVNVMRMPGGGPNGPGGPGGPPSQ